MTIESMTGFGAATVEVEGAFFRLELKSVNHRGTSVRARLPSEFSFLELDVRKTLTTRLMRGAIDLTVHRESGSTSEVEVVIDETTAASTIETLQSLAHRFDMPAPTLDLALKVGHFAESRTKKATPEALQAGLSQGLEAAIDGLLTMRRDEGAQLALELEKRLENLEQILATLQAQAPTVMAHFEERLRARLQDAERRLELQLDPSRLHAELVVYSDRSDVTEETVRAQGHLENARKLLSDDSRDKGKRFDFLAQELSREFNTVGSKCRDLGMASEVVNAKVELEKFREQVQNIV